MKGKGRMNILLTNDDGFDSPYLSILCRAAADRGHRVFVCAPHCQQSGKSHCFTMTPLRVHPREMDGAERAWSVEGTPADCVKAATRSLCERPDLVISGMNDGYNAGLSVYLSGTVGAAREASFYDIPALAVSVERGMGEERARACAEKALELGERLGGVLLPKHAVVNVNFPDLPPELMKPAVLCPINEAVFEDGYDEGRDADGTLTLSLGHYRESDSPDPGSDQDLLDRGHVSVSVFSPSGPLRQLPAGLLDEDGK